MVELVKISPKAIGVGQYQHDVNQKKLKGALDGVVENCVNFGKYSHRQENGPFKNKKGFFKREVLDIE